MRLTEIIPSMWNQSSIAQAAGLLSCFCLSLSTMALPVRAWEDDPSESSPVRRAPQVLQPKERGIGTRIEDIAFKDLAGQQHGYRNSPTID